MALFYIAFIYQDMDMLRSQLQTMLIILQVVNNVQEAVLPLLFRSFSKVRWSSGPCVGRCPALRPVRPGVLGQSAAQLSVTVAYLPCVRLAQARKT